MYKRLPAALKKKRIELGLSQAKFADQLMVPLGTYKSWELGLSTPDYSYRQVMVELGSDFLKLWERDKQEI